MTEKRLIGGSARCGKTINQYTCPDCKVPLHRVDELLFICPVCHKKIKALVNTFDMPYGYYTDNKVEKVVKELFKSKMLNCNDKMRR